jgi:enhancer of polycomb-like protein
VWYILTYRQPKRRQVEPAQPPALRIPLRQDGKPPDADLRQLSATRAEELKRQQERVLQLKKLRPIPKFPMVDTTIDAVTKQPNAAPMPPASDFCSVQTYYLPSPPLSAESSVASPEDEPAQGHGQVSIIQASPKKTPARNLPTFRRRLGRGGRILIDRRGRASISTDSLDPMVLDRIRYDNDDDLEEQSLVFPIDPHSDRCGSFRVARLYETTT